MRGKEPIAIIGTACRFPGSIDTPSKLESFLRDPRDVLGNIPANRLNLSPFQHTDPNHHGSTNVQKAYMLTEDIRNFDAPFFNTNLQEAEAMDPQQRLLLETVYEALEASGHSISSIAGSETSVFVGCMNGDYYDIQIRDSETIPKYLATGTARSVLSNRISYIFDLKGPSVTIDTACSSSVVALHDAVQSMRSGSSDMAIVGSCNLILSPEMFISGAHLGFLSPSSRSRMWDSAADGYARGEGAAAVILKPLHAAVRDGDHVESVIRETGVNSDGWTKSMTMPSADAQSALIRNTYTSIGLDPASKEGSCQYYEAHGTGTRTGDPLEAEAIHRTFYPAGIKMANKVNGSNGTNGITEVNGGPRTDKLFVGSIKTLVGHTEGCAGLAGLLKASIAVQKGFIPPNLLFDTVNPDIEDFMDHLQVPVKAKSWPALQGGHPRRASVGSYGFGGTNGHVIVESYETCAVNGCPDSPVTVPLVFSANSRLSLAANVRHFTEFLEQHPDVDMEDLVWTMYSRRSTLLPFNISFAGLTRERLLGSMSRGVSTVMGSKTQRAKRRTHDDDPAILGVFTGQGAHWAGMGRELLQHNFRFRESIGQCEDALSSLPEAPEWSIAEELSKDASTSRLGEAEIASPVVTALQLALVDLVRSAGVTFAGVVGHSSGEMAALYAAGIISLKHTMQIAYYKGYVSRFSGNKKGAMMAAALSYDSGVEFCGQPRFAGRIVVAASNSPNSITLAGDADAIMEAKEMLDEANLFNRLLKVDKAHHSHHVAPVLPHLRKYLKRCDIEIFPPTEECPWISTYHGDERLMEDGLESLKSEYWCDAALNCVLFAPAIECSLYAAGPFDMALEIGPHTALKGPTTQVVTAALGSCFPYVGLLSRGEDSIETMAVGLGKIWERLSPTAVDLDLYRRTFKGHSTSPKLVKGLPPYFWDHQTYWSESRASRNYRLRGGVFNQLLGRRCPDDSDKVMRWRNILQVDEIPWLRGHCYQGTVLFPIAGYVTLAIEAALAMSAVQDPGRAVELVSVERLQVSQALSLEEGEDGIESVVTLTVVPGDAGTTDSLLADLSCEMCCPGPAPCLERFCTARIRLCYQETTACCVLEMDPGTMNTEISGEALYTHMDALDLRYGGMFRAMRSGKRAPRKALTHASWPTGDLGSFLIHPAVLDVSLQATIVALHPPGSMRFRSPMLPVRIDCLRIRPEQFDVGTKKELVSHSQALITGPAMSPVGDVSVRINDSTEVAVQVQGVHFKGFEEPGPATDVDMFYKTLWEPDVFCVPVPRWKRESEKIDALQRIALFYVRKFCDAASDDDVEKFRQYHQHMTDVYKRLLHDVSLGRRPDISPFWLHDSEDRIAELFLQWEHVIDARLVRAVGKNLLSVCRGELEILEVMMEDGMLEEVYDHGVGEAGTNAVISLLVKQIAHRYPQMNVLEIGAGTGGTTKHILDAMRGHFASYTFTDISSGFFENAEDKLHAHGHAGRVTFKVLDVEKPAVSQGFQDTYDMVIAANVLHATRSLHATLCNVRKLLKPGGYLLLVEITGDPLFLFDAVIYGGLEQWWGGKEDGRVDHPGASHVRWDREFRGSGFSGLDKAVTVPEGASTGGYSVLMSQAVDDDLEILRSPLDYFRRVPNDLVIVGGEKDGHVAVIADEIYNRLASAGNAVTRISNLEKAAETGQLRQGGGSMLILSELEGQCFCPQLGHAQLSALQSVMQNSKDVLWVTRRCRDQHPYSNMLVGIGRALFNEMPHVNIQFIDFDNRSPYSARTLTEHFLRLVMARVLCVDSENHLWTTEPELAIEDAKIMIPRIVKDGELNDRLNSSKRLITENAPVDAVELVQSNGSALLRRRFVRSECAGQRIKTSFSTLHTLPGVTGSSYVCIGRDCNTGQRIAALSTVSGALIKVDPERAMPVDVPEQHSDEQILVSIVSLILTRVCTSLVPEGSHTLLLDPPPDVESFLTQPGLETGAMIGTQGSAKKTSFGVSIPFGASKTILCNTIPGSVAAVVNLAPNKATDLPSQLRSWLPYFEYPVLPQAGNERTQTLFKEACEVIKRPGIMFPPTQCIGAISANDIYKAASKDCSVSELVNWTEIETCPTRVLPLDQKSLFKPDKTYLFAGLTSDLGLSLCRWMMDNGARYFALASRNPQVPDDFVKEAQVLGAVITIFKVDLTDKSSVVSLRGRISAEMPPIVGVCNGAMILRDKLFSEMTVDDLNDVVAPKVESSRNLDEAFSNGENSESLDFFILFSSVAAIIGNIAQSNYHAGNMFVTSLAAQRRVRGLPASVLSLAVVSDVGFVHRLGRTKELNNIFVAIYEEDMHLGFAEAIHVGRAGSLHGPEVICGMKRITAAEKNLSSHWSRNPRFHGLVDTTTSSYHQRDSLVSRSTDVGEALQGVTDVDRAAELIQHCFMIKLERALRQPADALDPNMCLTEVGLDSVLAVEIRFWFMKMIQVEVPIFKIMDQSAASISKSAAKVYLAAQKESQANGTAADTEQPAEGWDESRGLGVEVNKGGERERDESRQDSVGNSHEATVQLPPAGLPVSSAVFVCGATGSQGGSVAREVLAAGYSVHCLTRDLSSSAAQDLVTLGAKVLPGDFDDETSLADAIAGTVAVFVNVHPGWQDPGARLRQVRKICAAARNSGTVEMLIYSSVWHTGEHNSDEIDTPGRKKLLEPTWELKALCEYEIEQAGVRCWTMIRPTTFMKNFLLPIAALAWPGLLDEHVIKSGLSPDVPNGLSDEDDMGKFALAAIRDPGRFHGKRVDWAGDYLTPAETAAALSEVTGLDFRAEYYTEEEKEKFAQVNPFLASQLYVSLYPEQPDPHQFEKWGVETTTFAEYLKRKREDVKRTFGRLAY